MLQSGQTIVVVTGTAGVLIEALSEGRIDSSLTIKWLSSIIKGKSVVSIAMSLRVIKLLKRIDFWS